MTTASPNAGYWFHQLQAASEFDSIVRSTGRRLSGAPELKDGDVLFIWLGGSEPGLKGWGIASVSTAATPPEGSSGEVSQPVAVGYSLQVHLSLPSQIPRSELASFQGLSDAPLIRQNQTGEYFRLSAEQALGLCDFLRSRNLDAPDIAPAEVLDPIARRLERELISLRAMLPEAVPPGMANQLVAQTEGARELLRSGGALAGYEQLKELIDVLAPIVLTQRGVTSSSLAPLDAARTRLMGDLFQIARFTDAGTRARFAAEQEHKARQRDAAPPADGRGPTAQPTPAEPPASAQTQPPPAAEPLVPPVVVPPAPPAATAPMPPPITPVTPPTPPAPVREPKDPLFKHWERSDLIGIGAAVNNLARYISHENLAPPVAIGVFGDWGSGKSFFIRALQSQIALLSSQSRDALAALPPRTTVFCSHIVQIEFNAWHFVESNLWASLAAHIFERLYAELERRGEQEGGNRNIDGLYQQFSAYKQAVAEQKRLSELVGALAAKGDKARERKREAEQSVKTRIASLMLVLREKLRTLTRERLSKQDRARLDELLRVSSLEELEAAAAEAAAVVKEGQTFLGRMRAQFSWWGGWQLALFVVLIAAAVFGLPRLAAWLLGSQSGNLERITTIIGAYATMALGALGWLSRAGRKLVAGAQKIERMLVEVREQVENQPDPVLDAAKRELAAAQSELTLVDQQIADQRGRLAHLADELDPNQLGRRLRAFLEERVKTDAYQKHLGLVSMVRKDFSSLYDLMQTYWQHRKVSMPEVMAEVRDALGQATQQQVPFIERIVLYIDDLDRCPEDKVVEVLQAVHLMLGLPLFVVVVAVDVRWVGQSIRKHYGKLVGWDEESGVTSVALASASADDYLEKIFQIPYRLHPMEPDARKLLLGGMLQQPYLSAAGATAQTSMITLQELVPKEFSLYPEEKTAIEELYQSVGSSPRRVRRFLDVYRLMRAGMEEGDVQDLVALRHYAVILALFAMLSGAPVTAPRVIELLRRESRQRQPNEAAPPPFVQPLADWYESALGQDKGTPDEMEVIRSAMSYIDALKLDRTNLLTILRRWIPEIARYSFREVRMQRI